MIERVSLQLHAALYGLEEAKGAAAATRHRDHNTALVARRLSDIEALVASAVRDLSSNWHDDDHQAGGWQMERRALLKLTATAAGSAFIPLGPLERIADALEHPGRVDAGLLDAYADVTTAYAHAFYTRPPTELAGPVQAHLDRLVGLTRHTVLPTLRTRLEAMIGDTAALAGTLAYDLDQPGTARAHLTLAADAAAQADDPALQAVATAMLAGLQVLVAPGDPKTAGLFDRAYTTLPDHAAPATRAWVAVHYATDCARNGDRLGYDAGTEAAHAAHQQHGAPASGFLSPQGWYQVLAEPLWFDQNRARGLAALDDRKAEPLLLRVVDDAADPRMRGNALNVLAGFYARQDEVDEACHTARRALDLAAEQQLPSLVRKIRTTRTILDPHHRTPAVRDLDSALAAA